MQISVASLHEGPQNPSCQICGHLIASVWILTSTCLETMQQWSERI